MRTVHRGALGVAGLRADDEVIVEGGDGENYTHTHTHTHSLTHSLRIEIFNNQTGELICREDTYHGRGHDVSDNATKDRFDETDYIAQVRVRVRV